MFFIINFKFLYYAKVQNANQQATDGGLSDRNVTSDVHVRTANYSTRCSERPAGETVIGASVMEKGTTNGTITGIDGDFSLNMSPNGTLVVSFVGYKTQEVQVKGQKQLQVVLSEDAEMLDEVVVIGYGTMKKSDLTGAVSSIGNKDIKDSPVSNLGQAIQGKISGVQIVDAGKPGDNVSIKIRGFSSINAKNDPLIIVDGAPYSGDINNINPNDVESMTVLKDAASNALYGARGANGVIIITTKRANMSGEAKVTFDAKWGC